MTLTGGAYLRGVLTTAGSGAWWCSAESVGFVPAFVAEVDALLARSAACSDEGRPRHSIASREPG